MVQRIVVSLISGTKHSVSINYPLHHAYQNVVMMPHYHASSVQSFWTLCCIVGCTSSGSIDDLEKKMPVLLCFLKKALSFVLQFFPIFHDHSIIIGIRREKQNADCRLPDTFIQPTLLNEIRLRCYCSMITQYLQHVSFKFIEVSPMYICTTNVKRSYHTCHSKKYIKVRHKTKILY